MKGLNLYSSVYGYSELKKLAIVLLLITCLTLLISACSDHSVTQLEAPSVNDELVSLNDLSPQSILGSGSSGQFMVYQAKGR